ncbi:probable RNA methyltransferase Y17G7B.18 [Paramacrobiotus metropolitanus]|uniref:probable RNA methyltransferase Y17G7B.18 n=1 Tax=Paramacrobiotus metropolitanus TaxID=2943436 RepID=UPI002445DB8C|nr:probable RNA methyltransferase Y17G7B.18 [Paramacrobiotus metropolitanus]
MKIFSKFVGIPRCSSMSCSVESPLRYSPAKPEASTLSVDESSRMGAAKRKKEEGSSDHELDKVPVGRRKRARLRHASTSSTAAGVIMDSEIKTEQEEMEKERWKRRMSERRHALVCPRDPLSLDPAFPNVAISPGVNEEVSPFSRRPAFPHRTRKDRFIGLPKNVDRHDPLQLNEQIQAYNRNSHSFTGPDGTIYASKREMLANRFRYGNYNRYYGYRIVDQDPRYRLMQGEWFRGKDCLDIGCNTGQFTLALTKSFTPRMMVGIDIDKELIKIAKRNIRHYITDDLCEREGFPKSLPILFGPIAAPAVNSGLSDEAQEFPYNIAFLHCDYVASGVDPASEAGEFDTILALSVTKWIHLNWGDEGLKRFFQRTFHHLRPGGLFIVEPQEWFSYCSGKSKGKLTVDMRAILRDIRLKPENFQEYLLSSEVGYESCVKIDTPGDAGLVRGFKRNVYVFTKPCQRNACS